MEVGFTDKAREDLDFWKKSGNQPLQNKISTIIRSILASPYEGIGKPEPLKHQFSGKWSRRIDKEHRVIYEVYQNKVIIHSLKGHYH